MGDGPLVLEDEEGKDFGAVIDMLMDLGLQPIDAYRFICSLSKKKAPASMYEVYGRGAIGELANSQRHSGLNVKGLRVIDLRVNRPDGKPWTLLNKEDQEMAMAMVERDDPDWIIGASPCRYLSVLNWNTSFVKINPEDVKRRVEERSKHLEFISKLYDRHTSKTKFVLHEHPLTSRAWRHTCMHKIIKRPGVARSTCDQCMYGQTAPVGYSKDGPRGPAKKATMFMSNSRFMLRRLARRCKGLHTHVHLSKVGKQALQNITLMLCSDPFFLGLQIPDTTSNRPMLSKRIPGM